MRSIRGSSNSEKKGHSDPLAEMQVPSSHLGLPPPALPAGQGQHFRAKGHPLGSRIASARFSGWFRTWSAHHGIFYGLSLSGLSRGIIAEFLHPGSSERGPSGLSLTTLLGEHSSRDRSSPLILARRSAGTRPVKAPVFIGAVVGAIVSTGHLGNLCPTPQPANDRVRLCEATNDIDLSSRRTGTRLRQTRLKSVDTQLSDGGTQIVSEPNGTLCKMRSVFRSSCSFANHPSTFCRSH